MARVALVSFYDEKSLSVRLLHSVLKENGHQPLSVFFKHHRMDRMAPPSEEEYRLLIKVLKDAFPLFVGLSLRSTYASVAKEVSRRLAVDGHTVIWGGIHATSAPEDAIEHADGVCIGEGESVILDITERLERGKELTGIPNLWIKPNGEIQKTAMKPLLTDLDSLPLPWWENDDCVYIEDGRVCKTLPAIAVTSYDIMTSRGCFYRCSYCIHSILYEKSKGLGKYVRRRSPESVTAELELAKKKFPVLSRIRFWDEVFTYDIDWIKRFTALYKENIGLPFFCYTTAVLAKPEILSELKSAGLRYISMGIQSGSERVRREVFNRPIPDNAILKAAHIFRQQNLFPEYDLIIDNPFDTEDDHVKTLDLLLKLHKPFKLYEHSLTYFPNYKITEKALAEGHIQPEDVEHIRSKGFTRWHEVFDKTRDPREMFWGDLYYLTQYKLFPRGFVRFLSKNRFARGHARVFNAFLRPLGHGLEKTRIADFFVKEKGLAAAFAGLARKLSTRIRNGFSR